MPTVPENSPRDISSIIVPELQTPKINNNRHFAEKLADMLFCAISVFVPYTSAEFQRELLKEYQVDTKPIK